MRQVLNPPPNCQLFLLRDFNLKRTIRCSTSQPRASLSQLNLVRPCSHKKQTYQPRVAHALSISSSESPLSTKLILSLKLFSFQGQIRWLRVYIYITPYSTTHLFLIYKKRTCVKTHKVDSILHMSTITLLFIKKANPGRYSDFICAVMPHNY